MTTKSKKRKPKTRQRQRALPAPHAFAYTVHDATAMGGPGKTKIYELGKTGVLELFKDAAGRRMVTGASLRALLGVKEEEDVVA